MPCSALQNVSSFRHAKLVLPVVGQAEDKLRLDQQAAKLELQYLLNVIVRSEPSMAENSGIPACKALLHPDLKPLLPAF